MKYQIIFRKLTDSANKYWTANKYFLAAVEADSKEAAINKWRSEAKANSVFVRCNQID